MPLHLPRRRVLRAVIYLVCLSLVLDAADLIWVQIRRDVRPGFGTTRIVAPVLPDGSVDYLMAHDNVYGQGVTPENNAAVLLLSAVGRDALPSNQPTDGMTDRLGMPHLADKGDYFVGYEPYCRKHSADGGGDPLFTSPQLRWPPSIAPIAAQWVKENEKPLDLIVESSRRTRFFIPWYAGARPELLVEILLPHLNAIQDAGRALLTRAMLRLEDGDVAGFEDNVLAVHRLARLLAQAPTLIEQLAAWGPLESAACRVDRLAAASGKLSAEQLRQLRDQLAALGEMPPYAACIDEGERFLTLDIMQTIAHGSPERRDLAANVMCHGNLDIPKGIPDLAVRFWPIPCEDSMRLLNDYYDGMIAAAREPTYPRRIAALNLWNEDLVKLHGRNWIFSVVSPDLAVSALMLSPVKCENHFDETRMERRLTLIALALAEYKAGHGNYPVNLGGLPVDSNDLYVDRPLIYAPNDKGYLLYSVGPDMTDDGGKGDDIAANVP